MRTRNFDFYADPGHGWMKTPLKLIKSFGVEDKISSYSFMRGNFAYLEEDCDAGVVIDALKANAISIKVHNYCGDKRSKIRNYTSFDRCRIDWAACAVAR